MRATTHPLFPERKTEVGQNPGIANFCKLALAGPKRLQRFFLQRWKCTTASAIYYPLIEIDAREVY